MLAPRSVAPGNQLQPLREHGAEHTVSIERLLEGKPGRLVQAKHDHDVVGRQYVQRGVLQPQREVSVEAGVGDRPHVRNEPDGDAVVQLCADLEVSARDVESVVPVLLVQFGGILQKGDDAEAHLGKLEVVGAASGLGAWASAGAARPTTTNADR